MQSLPMRIRFSFLLLFFLCSVQLLFSQEVKPELVLTEADWKKYAQIEVLTSTFLSQKEEELKTWVKTKEDLGGGARFNQIKSVWGNAKKEIGIELTDKERLAYQEYLTFQDSLQKLVVLYQAGLIRDEKVLGLEVFEQLSKIIRDDPSQKEKLVQEVARLKKKAK
jgi:hypothetical protein